MKFVSDWVIRNALEDNLQGRFHGYGVHLQLNNLLYLNQDFSVEKNRNAMGVSSYLRRIFSPCIESLSETTAMITHLSGHDVFAVYEPQNHHGLFKGLEEIYRFLEDHSKIEVTGNILETSYNIGVAYGQFEWNIHSDGQNRCFSIYGEAVLFAREASQAASPNSINISPNVLAYIKRKYGETYKKGFTELSSGYVDFNPMRLQLTNLNRMHLDFVEDHKATNPQKEIELSFIGKKEHQFSTPEFRSVMTVCIHLFPKADLGEMVKLILEKSKKYGGSHPQFTHSSHGKKIQLFFGATHFYENHEERALDFTLELFSTSAHPIRAGLAKGIVYVGHLGSSLRSQFNCIGPSVALAEDLSQLSYDKIIVSKEIREKMKAHYEIKAYAEEAVSPHFEKTSAYELIRKKNRPVIHDFESELIGRQLEIQKIETIYEECINENLLKVLYVEGVPGIGKSRLIYESKKRLVERANWVQLKCDEVSQKPFNAIIEYLCLFFHIEQFADSDKRTAVFENQYNKLIQNLQVDDQKANEMRIFLENLLTEEPTDAFFQKLDPKGRLEYTYQALTYFFSLTIKNEPLILEIEDGQWIDPNSLEWLKRFSLSMKKQPILIVSSCRLRDDGSYFRFGLDPSMPIDFVNLKGFDLRQCLKYIEDNFNFKHIDIESVEKVYDKTQGIPFYLEQIILYLIENSQIKEDFNLSIHPLELPESVQKIILARIDRLPKDFVTIAKKAAVIGNEFHTQVLQEMVDDVAFQSFLSIGIKENIWVKQDWENVFQFKHALIRDALYNIQLKEQQAITHQQAAKAMEKVFQGNFEGNYDIAQHYEKGRDITKAIGFYFQAGRDSLDKYRNEDAKNIFNRIVWLFENQEKSEADYPVLKEKYLRSLIYKISVADNTAEWPEGWATMVKILRFLNIPFPTTPTSLDVVKDLLYVKVKLSFFNEKTLRKYRTLTSSDIEFALRALAMTATPAYFQGPNAIGLLILRLLKLSLIHGFSKYSAYGIGLYALIEGVGLGQYQKAFSFGDLSIYLLKKRFKDDYWLGKSYQVMGSVNNHWVNPLKSSLGYQEKCYELAMKVKDYTHVVYSSGFTIFTHLYLGDSLDTIYDICESDIQFFQELRIQDELYFYQLGSLLMIQRLTGKTSVHLNHFDEEEYIQRLYSSGSTAGAIWMKLAEMIAMVHLRAFSKALAIGLNNLSQLDFLKGQIISVEFQFYFMVAWYQCQNNTTKRTNKLNDLNASKAKKKANHFYKALEKWMKNSNENFEHKFLYIRALKKIHAGLDQVKSLERALVLSDERGFYKDSILIAQSLTEQLLEKGKMKDAQKYTSHAKNRQGNWEFGETSQIVTA